MRRWLTFERLFILIFILALVLRFAVLDLKLLHHDEAVHAWFSYESLTKGAYAYDPMYHGPFLYYVTAGMFALLGDTDLVARLLPPSSDACSSRSSMPSTGSGISTGSRP